MTKPEWEKTRDTMDYIAGLNGQATTGVWGAMGAEARRGQYTPTIPVRKSPTASNPPVINQAPTGPAPPMSAFSRFMVAVALLYLATGAVLGGWFAATQVADMQVMPAWQRVVIGLPIGGLAAYIAGWLFFAIVEFVFEVLIPALIRLAIIGGVIYFIYMVVQGQI